LTKQFSGTNIDDIANLTQSKVYLYSGTRDTVVYPAVMKASETYYKAFLSSTSTMKTNFGTASEHCQPTDSYGNACTFKGTPYINNCNMDGAGEALNWIYGTLKPKGTANSKNIISVDQSKFVPSGYTLSSLSMGPKAFAYVPTACQSGSEKKCYLHIAFHGCLQTISDIQDKFYTHAGYNEWAETNNIIVIYPQAVKSSFMPTNPNGCYDWWGYVNKDYAFKNGPQMQLVRKMAHSFIDKAM